MLGTLSRLSTRLYTAKNVPATLARTLTNTRHCNPIPLKPVAKPAWSISAANGLTGGPGRIFAAPSSRTFTRSLWYLSSNRQGSHNSELLGGKFTTTCSCGCGLKGVHTKGDKELVEFLVDEIATEKKNSKNVASSIGDFKFSFDKSDVTLARKFNDEEIEITFNVNHTVDAEGGDELNVQQNKADDAVDEMRSSPNFIVDIMKGKKVLSFRCSYADNFNVSNPEEGFDVFNIDEVTIYEGDFKDSIYCVSGDILDGYLYDLFLNMLEERGITNDFVQNMSDLATAHEHQLYIGLLENLKDFVSGK